MYLNTKDLFIIVVICLYVRTSKPSKSITYVSTTVTFNPLYMQDHRLAVTSNKTLDIIYNVAKDYPVDPWLNLELAIQNPKTKAFRTLLQYNVNLCKILSKQGKNLITTWLLNFMKYGNLPKTCPFLKGNYSWNNLNMDNLFVPDFLPGGIQRVKVQTYFRMKPKPQKIANITLFVQIK